MTNSDVPEVHHALHKSTTNIGVQETVPNAPIQVGEDANLLDQAAESTVPNATIDVGEDGAKLLDQAAEKTVPNATIQEGEEDANLLNQAAEETAPIRVCDDAKLLVDNSFEDKTTRLGFIQKVLAIKFMQLVEVVIIMTIFVIDYHNGSFIWRLVYLNSFYVFGILSLVYVVTFGLLIYCTSVQTRNPYRYILLITYPLSYTLIISFAITLREKLEFLSAWYYYCLAVLTLLVYSIFICQTKLEFNIRHAFLVSPLIITVIFAVCYELQCLNFPPPRFFYVLYPTIAVGCDLIFFLVNLEKMISKNYRVTITPADFFDATMHMHTKYYYTFVNPIVIYVKNVFKAIPAHLTNKRHESN